MTELTVGKLRSIMSRLDDDCPVELGVGDTGFGCEQIDAEVDGEIEGAWLSIFVKSNKEQHRIKVTDAMVNRALAAYGFNGNSRQTIRQVLDTALNG